MRLKSTFLTALALLFAIPAMTAPVSSIPSQPLASVVKAAPAPVTNDSQLFVITWGGDVATLLAQQKSFFKEDGAGDVKLTLENDFAKQVEAFIAGRTPYLRGTMGMINAASEVAKLRGIDMVVVYQMTWSTGGDTMVVRSDRVKTPADLKGKTIALQLHGPHMDFLGNILATAGVPQSSVNLKWFRDLQLPLKDTGKIEDPVSAFQADPTIDAVMAISPDANALTSGGSIGTGAEGSVKGAKILLTSKTASRIIADVYAVRKDYFDTNRAKVQGFVHALMRGQEALRELTEQKSGRQAEFRSLMSSASDLLFGNTGQSADVEGMLGDCEFVGFDGNVAFFTGQGSTRTLENLTEEGQAGLISMKLLGRQTPLLNASWDYAALSSGLKYATKNVASLPAPAPRFEPAKVAAAVTREIDAEPTSWAEKGTLFQLEIKFKPNQADFSEATYATEFGKALRTAQTYQGALIIIEGHVAPGAVENAKKDGKSEAEIRAIEQRIKTLSQQRADAVRDGFLQYCTNHKFRIDATSFTAVGLGTKLPKNPNPTTNTEWQENFRAVFRIKNVEAELATWGGK